MTEAEESQTFPILFYIMWYREYTWLFFHWRDNTAYIYNTYIHIPTPHLYNIVFLVVISIILSLREARDVDKQV